ncbi:MAG: S8 family serine peptidase, partial [Candidatus Kariarchaeaceae archaeon]
SRADGYYQTARSPFPPNSKYYDFYWSNSIDHQSVEFGVNWTSDDPQAKIFIHLRDVDTGFITDEISDITEKSFTGSINDVPKGNYYLGIGNSNSSESISYEIWARFPHNTNHGYYADGFDPFSGVSPGSNIIGLKVLDDDGVGTAIAIIDSIEWILENKLTYNIAVAALCFSLDTYNILVDIAVNTLSVNGIIPITPAGNGGLDRPIHSPGSARESITVGAVDNENKIARYSSIGNQSFSYNKPDVLAPGGSEDPSVFANDGVRGKNLILAADSNTKPGNLLTNDYAGAFGTSIAAAHVAGLAILLVNHYNTINTWRWDYQQYTRIKIALLSSTFETASVANNITDAKTGSRSAPLNPLLGDYYEGWGIVDAQAAFDSLFKDIEFNTPEFIQMSLNNSYYPKVANRKFQVSTFEDHQLRIYAGPAAEFEVLIINSYTIRDNGLFIKKYMREALIHFDRTNASYGDNILVIRLIDADSLIEDVSFVLNDNFIPQVSFSNENNTISNRDFLTLDFKSRSNAVELYLDGSFIGLIHSDVLLEDLSEGLHEIVIVERNNVLADNDTIFFTLDRTPPELNSSLNALDQTTIFENTTIDLNASDGSNIDRFEFYIDYDLIVSLDPTSTSYTIQPFYSLPGDHSLSLVAFDIAGNNNSINVNVSFEHTTFLLPHGDTIIDQSEILVPSFLLDWNVSSNLPSDYSILLNNEVIYTDIWDGLDITYSLTGYEFGVNVVRLVIQSRDNILLMEDFIVKVIDFRPPTVFLSPDIYSFNLDATYPFSLDVEVYDPSISFAEITSNGLVIDTFNRSGDELFFNSSLVLDGAPFDLLNLKIKARDLYNNTASAIIFNQWIDLTQPVFITCPSSQTVIVPNPVYITWEWEESFFIGYDLLVNDILIENGMAHNSTILLRQINTLPIGNNSVTLRIYDVGDHMVSCTVIITIQPSDQTLVSDTSYNNNYIYALIIMFLIVLTVIKYRNVWM